ncbi:hypothetical protein [Herbiconiux daphne]|uniref:Uncharacterized protein n=1 Tax=Herbiconiux daphne TaxID=2970914 RepID=A0ABT2H517_9MICO|nr:hypothetical protein [Herbiconiux daphne]MCS5735021.1 hypothetical protein [Herbiconiux daphne]
MIRNVGTILLAVGFVLLAVAVLLRDPVALDANIGAGILSLAGLALGGVGLVLVVIGAVVGRRRGPAG